MKYRAVANGNIVDDVHPSLVEAGVYVPIDEEVPGQESEQEEEPEGKNSGARSLDKPEAPLQTVAHKGAGSKRKRSRKRS